MAGDESQWERSMQYLEDAIDITAEIGAKKMLFSEGHAGYDGQATIELVTGYLKEPSAYAGLAIKRVRELLEEE